MGMSVMSSEKVAGGSEVALDSVRAFLVAEVSRAGRDISLKSLSLAVGRNPAYIHQFIYRGSPRHLPEDVRHKIAEVLGINERSLRPEGPSLGMMNALIDYIDHPSQHAYLDGPWFVPQSFLDEHLYTSGQDIRIAVVGDCAADFGISTGDMIMLNIEDRCPLKAGYFALDAGDHIRVRHLEQVSQKDKRIMISGNGVGAYSRYETEDEILGRVLFHAHIFSHMKGAILVESEEDEAG